MTLEELKNRFQELFYGLEDLDDKITGLQVTRDITWSEMNEVANKIWEIEDPESFAKWKKGPK